MKIVVAFALIAGAVGTSSEAAAQADSGGWVRRPSSDDIQRYYPDIARRKDVVGGQASLNCQVTPKGTLNECAVVTENPAGLGFGDAGLKLTRLMKVDPAKGSTVEFTVNFRRPEQVPEPQNARGQFISGIVSALVGAAIRH